MLSIVKQRSLELPRYYTNLRSNILVNTYTNLIPVILISIFVLYEDNMMYVANSPLGKIIAILLIVYYTSVKLIYGLLACSLIMLYYQYNYEKGIINTQSNVRSSKSDTSLHIYRDNPNKNYIHSTEKISGNENLKYTKSHLEGYLETFGNQNSQNFKDQYCKNGVLMNKNTQVNLEMVEHIYPDITFKNKKCNPCVDTCDFSLITKQLNTEESLKPKTSDDFSIKAFLEKINEFTSDFIPSLWVKSEPFSLLENINDNESTPKKK